MAEVLASLKKIGGNGEQYTETVLWTNPSPTADFSAQTVTLSESVDNFKYIGIRYCFNRSNVQTLVSTAIYETSELKAALKNSSTDHNIVSLALMNQVNQAYNRLVYYVSPTSIEFSIGYKTNTTGTTGNACIPLEILGINELAHGKKLPETILWTNSNPSVDFANQTITLSDSLANYDLLKVTYELSRNNTAIADKVVYVDLSTFTADNSGRFAFGGTYSSNYGRLLVKVSDTSVTISDSKAFGGTTTANSTMIPLQLSGCIIS